MFILSYAQLIWVIFLIVSLASCVTAEEPVSRYDRIEDAIKEARVSGAHWNLKCKDDRCVLEKESLRSSSILEVTTDCEAYGACIVGRTFPSIYLEPADIIPPALKNLSVDNGKIFYQWESGDVTSSYYIDKTAREVALIYGNYKNCYLDVNNNKLCQVVSHSNFIRYYFTY